MNQKKKEEVRGTFEFLKDWGDALTRWTERWIPDALVIVIGLSIVAYILALIWGFKPEIGLGSRSYLSIQAWGKGFWELIAFAMQMCLIMMTGYILACSPPVRKLMNWISGWSNPEKPWQAIVVMCLFSMIVAWFNWGTSLIASAMLALFIVKRNPKVDYRLLIAAAYLGLGCTWHSGLSGSSPLLVATPDNFVIKAKLLDGVIPISQTILHPFNLTLTIIIVVVVTIMMALMHPKPGKAFTVSPQLMDQLKLYEAPPMPTKFESPSDWMNWWPGFNILLFIGGLVWLIWYFANKGLALTLDVVNFAMLMLGVLFHWRPWSFLKATEDAGKAVWGIVDPVSVLCRHPRPLQIHYALHCFHKCLCGNLHDSNLPPLSLLVWGASQLPHPFRRWSVCCGGSLYSSSRQTIGRWYGNNGHHFCLV